MDKTVLRRTILERRGQLDEADRRCRSEAVAARILQVLESHPGLQRDGGSLFTFMPFGHEPDIFPVAQWCWKQGIPVLVPKTIREPRKLRLHRIDAPDLLVPGTWGIREPVESAPMADGLDVVVVLVPGVAFDPQGGRLGYGGGYYDRFFAELRGAGNNPLKLAPAFDLQLVDRVPMEAHDERMDRVITESREYRCKNT